MSIIYCILRMKISRHLLNAAKGYINSAQPVLCLHFPCERKLIPHIISQKLVPHMQQAAQAFISLKYKNTIGLIRGRGTLGLLISSSCFVIVCVKDWFALVVGLSPLGHQTQLFAVPITGRLLVRNVKPLAAIPYRAFLVE